MFGHDPPKAKEPIDYTGLKIGAISGTGASAFYLFWQRRHGTCGFQCPGGEYICHQDALEEFEETHLVPQGNMPTLFYTLPIGIADFLIISGALRLAEKFFSKASS